MLPLTQEVEKETEFEPHADSFSGSSPLTSRPKKGKKIAFDILQRMQYEVTHVYQVHEYGRI